MSNQDDLNKYNEEEDNNEYSNCPFLINIDHFTEEEVLTLSILEVSLFSLLIENANINEGFNYTVKLNSDKIEYVLGPNMLRITLVEWQVHNGYKIDIEWALDKSIDDIARKAIENGRYDLMEYHENMPDLKALRLKYLNESISFSMEQTSEFLAKDKGIGTN
jgi:hypothetical protein